METRPVFYDVAGRRRVLLPRIAGFLGVFLTLVITAFAVSLTAAPILGTPVLAKRHHINPHRLNDRPRLSGAEFRKARHELFTEISQRHQSIPPIASKGSKVVAAFYASWQEAGSNSLRAFGDHLTHVIPSWLHLSADGAGLDFEDYDFNENPHNAEVEAIARRKGVRIMPMLTNSVSGPFDPTRAHALLTSPAKQALLATRIRSWLLARGYQGLNVDLESLSDGDEGRMAGFLQILAKEFHPYGLELTMDIESSTDPDLLKANADACDWLVLMAYDEHAERTAPGPIASLGWSERVLAKTLAQVPSDKLVLGIGSYAYDWIPGQRGLPITYQDALATASGYRDEDSPEKVIDFDDTALNSTFDYQDDAGKDHEVWMLDAASAYNQWLGARSHGLRGASVWALGMEDPGVWSFLDHRHLDAKPQIASGETVQFPYGVDHTGKGEILRVLRHPTEGKRSFDIDGQTGLVTDETYHQYPFPYVIQHSGYQPKTLALTFDDGPDPKYTPMVLDELKRLGVKATFFVVGRNVEADPSLVRRIYDEGHEIGSHTFTHPDLGAVSPRRAELELNTTERAIQSVLGRSTQLFRPPFNADSEPQAPSDVEPVNLADHLGYRTVGEKIDPEDWDLNVREPDGTVRPKTPQDVEEAVVGEVADLARKGQAGNVILLHDAGGPRDATVAALRTLIPELQKKGYRFVTVSELMGLDRDAVMPRVSPKDRLAIWFDGLVMSGAFTTESTLAIGFTVAIVLGLIRYLFVLPLAFVHRRRQAHQVFDSAYKPRVAALIAAYNEERVIVRTIESLLASTYVVDEIVVVDDGSSDGTTETVAKAFADDPRVRLAMQENSGKASALNRALALTDAEIVVCIDADTQLHPDAVGLLVRHFQDEEVAAVAGNVRVGNQTNILTKWQALEYTTSQNLDRRAYGLLNSITVVPGAIGAWRREAVREVGGYQADTLAEDMDLTWRLRQAEYRLENEPNALAFTEAPDNFRGFFKQRFRWAYGTLQCLVKHRSSVGRYGWFGAVALPTLWLFQVVFQALAPLVDLQVVYSLVGWALGLAGAGSETGHLQAAGSSQAITQVLGLYAIFLVVEIVGGLIAYRMERQKAAPLVWLLLQRFVYRQVMYGVVYKSFMRALAGGREGWGKLERKGTVEVASSGA